MPSTTRPSSPGTAGRRGAPSVSPPKSSLLVYAGLTFSYRRLELLLEAMAAIRPRAPALHAVCVGGRPAEIASLQAVAARFGLLEAVSFVGPKPQAEVVLYLQAADLLVLPDAVTDVTASPLKLFEYLATARAVVLPDIPALQEILPEEVGYYFRRGDAQDLAAVLERALADPARARREAAGRAAVLPFTYAERARRILAVADQAREG